MRPSTKAKAHHTSLFSELVCSNSLKSNSLENAAGLLKEEMRHLDSLIIRSADLNSVPAGQALAVDRDLFASYITNEIKQNPNIEIINEEVTICNRKQHLSVFRIINGFNNWCSCRSHTIIITIIVSDNILT